MSGASSDFRGPVRGGPWAAVFAVSLAALLGLAPPARAQRGAAAPIYQQNLDSLIEGAEDWLARLEEQGWFLRGQSTKIVQGHPRIRARYTGENSLGPRQEGVLMQTIDLVIGRRLWEGAEVVAVPSPTRGYGFSNNRGLGSLSNNEAFHAGTNQWDFNLSRFFVRQTIGLSYDAYGQDDDPMRFAEPLARERITLTGGKFAVWDFFDNNRYAHDPRTQFLSYALVATGAVDTAMDPAGYNYGAVAEWENGTWATRLGFFQVARNQGGEFLDPRITRAWQTLFEVDRFWWSGNRAGALRVLAGASRTRSANYNDLTRAIQNGDTDAESLRAFRIKSMAAINFDQEISDGLGIFGRVGWNNGKSQDWMFIEMDWSVSAGVSINGWTWERFDDTVGVAMNIGGAHAPQRRFLAAGGLGFIIGDGRISYAPEVALEAYYSAAIGPGLYATADVQLVFNPTYNAARGPVPVGSLRLRAAF